MQIQRFAHISIILTFIVTVLIVAKDLLIPIVLAVFVWFIVREMRKLLRRVKFIREKIPQWTLNLVSSIGLFLIISIVVGMVTSNIQELSKNMPLYESNFRLFIGNVNATYDVDILGQLKGQAEEINVSKMFSLVINTISSLFGNVFIILIYFLFLLLEESGFPRKWAAFHSDREHLERSNKILQKMDNSIGEYLFLKTLISLLTAVLSFVVLLIFGVNGAFFWALIIFLLNYIPTIGSLIASVFPALFAVLQFGELSTAFWILGIIGLIQMVVGNFLEPKVMGNSLNISSLVVLLSLSLWGAIWGIVGMALSVPITVILLILFSEFPSTRPIATLLSEKGRLKS